MKKLSTLFLFITILALTFVSCSSDSDNDNKVSIVGKWEFTQYGIGPLGKEVLSDRVNMTDCGRDYMEFLSDGTYKVVLFTKDNGECSTLKDSGKYTLNGSIFTLRKGGIENLEPANSELTVLNKTTIKIRIIPPIEKESISEISILKKI